MVIEGLLKTNARKVMCIEKIISDYKNWPDLVARVGWLL
jgi:hypothetical protein